MDTKQKIIDRAKELLASGEIGGFLALKQEGVHIAPHLFTDPAELDMLSLGDGQGLGDARYPLVKLLYTLAERSPQEKFGIMVRGCDERALNQLLKEDRSCPMTAGRVVPVGFSCPEELARACECAKPWPDALVAGEQTQGFPPPEADTADLMTELQQWFGEADRCLKCLGCKNSCPVCVCHECTLEEEAMLPQRQLPPTPNFLFTRAVHMVDRCVYCGLCEAACPAGIPLKKLYRLVAQLVGQGIPLVGAAPRPQPQPPAQL